MYLWWANGGHQLKFNAPKLTRDPYLYKNKVPSNHHNMGNSKLLFSLLKLGRICRILRMSKF